MGKKFTKNIKGFTLKGFYNPETGIINDKDGDENIIELLATLAKDGEEISVSAKTEDTIEDIATGEDE